jgi:hypothetical protein
LEGIGGFNSTIKPRAYQDDVTAPLGREDDYNAGLVDDDDEMPPLEDPSDSSFYESNSSNSIVLAMGKVDLDTL